FALRRSPHPPVGESFICIQPRLDQLTLVMAEGASKPLWERRSLLICILLATVTFCAYLPSLRNGFVGMDDPAYVYANTHVRGGLTWENVRWALTAYEKSLWHPVTMLSIQLDCQLFGLRPSGHHLTSLLLHCANT